jgi:8-oxo-dGTP pyrophosphatase MutT (NUDIX family)
VTQPDIRTWVPEPSLAQPVVTTGTRMLWKSRFGSLHVDDVRFASGRDGTWYRVVHGDGRPPVAVLPLCGDHVALVRVWRHAVSAWEWGLPRGYAQDDDPEQTARSECAEEIGTAPEELIRLGEIWPESAHNSCTVILYAARMPIGAMTAEPSDTEEIAEVRWVPLSGLGQAIRDGHIRDGYTLAAYGYWAAWQEGGR